MTYRHKLTYEECKNTWERKRTKDLLGQYEYCAYIRRKFDLKAGQHLYIKSYYNKYMAELRGKDMRIECKNCGERVLKSDICGDYCVHCIDLNEVVNKVYVPKKGQEKGGK